MFADLSKKILFLSIFSGCMLIGMENPYFAVRVISSFRSFPDNGPACTKYPILIIDKIRNTPNGYNFFDLPIKSIEKDPTHFYIALVTLSDDTVRKIDLRVGK